MMEEGGLRTLNGHFNSGGEPHMRRRRRRQIVSEGVPEEGGSAALKKPEKRGFTMEDYMKKMRDARQEGMQFAINHPERVRKGDPVNRLARTLKRYKDKRIRSEDELMKIMEKVKLDKGILLKEKIESIWGNPCSSDFKQVQSQIGKCKQKRQDLNIKQKEAYLTLLRFLKERRPGGAVTSMVQRS